MKNHFVVCSLLLSSILFSQDYAITDSSLIRYYDSVNKAELSIVDNDLTAAERNYSEAFKAFQKPHAKDLYNNMIVLLKLQNHQEAYKKYSMLKCLEYQFEASFFQNNFPSKFKMNNDNCKIKLDYTYKKTLDSIVELDQHYRLLSNGDYAKYRKELTETDSIVATALARLIREKGFPNEYNVGLSSTIGGFSQRFYLIILHQLATNLYSSQKVNFSKQMDKALNEGKISPEYAVFLFDLNNGREQFFSKHFSINQFVVSNGSQLPIYEQVKNGTATVDCCYVTYGFFPEKRTDYINKLVIQLNENRNKIGLGSIDDAIKKSVFILDNKDYRFTEMSVDGHQAEKEADLQFLKDRMFKIK